MNSTKREESFFENGEKIKWTLYDERSDNLLLLLFLFFFCEPPGDTDLDSRFLKHEFLVVRHRAYRQNFRFLG